MYEYEINQCCPTCGVKLPEYFWDGEWMHELEALITKFEDPNLYDLSNWTLPEIFGLYKFLSKKYFLGGARNGA